MKTPCCRFCKANIRHTFVDLGMSPLANSYLTSEELNSMEPFYPLHVYVCDNCFLVQLEEFTRPESIFSDYAYFASYSDTWLQHAKSYVEMMIERFSLNSKSQVIEVASNDGYLLQYFLARGVPVLGVEPAANVAKVAIDRGIRTYVDFFGVGLAHELIQQGMQADLVIGNNVLAHVPMLNDFVQGLEVLLKPQGVVTLEFPHLLRLMKENQFDTIYHEHFSYFSFMTVERILTAHSLQIFDVEELSTHGGSLRIFASRADNPAAVISQRVGGLRAKEVAAGLDRLESYFSYAERVRETKLKLLTFLIDAKRKGKSIVGYGAAAKGNTLLNYCGIRTDFVDYVVDRSPHKQNHFLPGTHIPIYHPDRVRETQPDLLLILPWNLADEIIAQMQDIRTWGGQFIVPIPEVRVIP
jgi:2-polyprenyl-3-methyl-5-hydroxy-6-metoxy-1,4-benzoquinol methylase